MGRMRRVMSMPYPPPSLLPIPTGIGHCPKPLTSLELDALQLMSPQEESSNQQLFHTVCHSLSAWVSSAICIWRKGSAQGPCCVSCRGNHLPVAMAALPGALPGSRNGHVPHEGVQVTPGQGTICLARKQLHPGLWDCGCHWL